MKPILLIVLAACSTLLWAQAPQPKPEDVATADSIVKAVYNVISGPAGEKRNWDRMRSLFTEDSRMIAIGRSQTGEVRRRAMTVEDYIKLNGPALEQRGFFEKEAARRSETFGNLVHVWSTYEAKSKLEDEKPFMRGINSLQLWNDGKRWWVLSIVWQAEDPNLKLPDKYLKDGNR